jgi:hypothetical protein
MRTPFYPLLAIATLSLISCASHPAASRKLTKVTVAELLTSPDRFEGARVLVTGFFLAPMVGDIALYETEPDYHHYSPGTGIPLTLDPRNQNVMPFQLKRCVVEGSFHVSHAPGVRNRIGEIKRLELAQ